MLGPIIKQGCSRQDFLHGDQRILDYNSTFAGLPRLRIMVTDIRVQYLWKQWIGRSATADEVFELFGLLGNDGAGDSLWSILSQEKAAEAVKYRINHARKKQMLENILRSSVKAGTRSLDWPWKKYAVAAAVLVVFGITAYFYSTRFRLFSITNHIKIATNVKRLQSRGQKRDLLP